MKLTTQIASVILVCFTLSCDSMREVSIYEPSKSISAFEKFPYKTLFTNSEENGIWGLKTTLAKKFHLIQPITSLARITFILSGMLLNVTM